MDKSTYKLHRVVKGLREIHEMTSWDKDVTAKFVECEKDVLDTLKLMGAPTPDDCPCDMGKVWFTTAAGAFWEPCKNCGSPPETM